MGRRWVAGPGRLGLAVAAIGVALLVLPAAAPADGTYTVWSCRGPDGRPAGTAAWNSATVHASRGEVAFADTCGEGGALRASLAPDRSFGAPATGTWTFAAPAGTRILAYELWRALEVAPPALLGFYDYAAAVVEHRAGAAAVAHGCATRGACRVVGDPADPDAVANRFTERARPLEAIGLEVSCRNEWCTEPPGTAARATLHRARVVLEDRHPPTVPRLAGELTEGRPLAERATVLIGAADRGAGVAAISLAVDGRPQRTVRLSEGHAACGEPYTIAQPCPADVERALELDLSGLAGGGHTASGTVVDAAGNATAWGPVRFTVQPPAPPAPGGSPPPRAIATPPGEAPRLRLASALLEHAPGRVARLRGRLTTRAGEPVAGARLTVAARSLGVAREVVTRLRPVTTDAGGLFTVALRGDGARRVSVAFAPSPGAPATARASATVRARLGLRAAPSRRLLVKGRRLVMRGRVTGAGPSAKGTLVHVQSIVNGRWRPVATVRARADGSYRWRYRFVHLMRDTIFRFRAVVARTPGWPWPTVRSRPVVVRVDLRAK